MFEKILSKLLILVSVLVILLTAIMLFCLGSSILNQNLPDTPEDDPSITSGDEIISSEKEDMHTIVLKNNKLFQNNVVTDWQSFEIDGSKPYSSTNTLFERGITVSQFNSDKLSKRSIDWKSLKQDGIDYAIIRIGGRGYETGEIYVDSNFLEYIEAALENGIKTGCYFYSQAITQEEVDEEIALIIESVAQYKDSLDYPIGVSLERNGRTANLSDAECVDIIKYFCIKLMKAGYTPMIVESEQWFEEFAERTFEGYLKLVGTKQPSPPSSSIDNCIIWEYEESSEGVINSVRGLLELSISVYGLLE